jgi:hypothetical protein
MTQDNIVKIYLAALAEIKPEGIDKISNWEWDEVGKFADKIMREIEPYLEAYKEESE